MARTIRLWAYTLRIQDEWKAALNDTITVQELARVIADRLEVIDFGADYNFTRDELVDQFRSFSEDATGDKNEFDVIFEELYDFADEVKLWVQTII